MMKLIADIETPSSELFTQLWDRKIYAHCISDGKFRIVIPADRENSLIELLTDLTDKLNTSVAISRRYEKEDQE